jgi:pimeloyl-ACP methyl ester carboxylesterase
MDIVEKLNEIDRFLKQQKDEFVTVRNGVRIRYIVAGAGDPVLLIHGLGGSLEAWGFNMIELSKHFQVYALDLPGHGLSQLVPDCYTFTCGMEVMTEILESIGLKQTAVIGHSMGGIICLGTALRLPDVVNKLILIDAAGLSRYVPWSYRLASLPGLGNIILSIVNRIAINTSRRLFFNENLLPVEVVNWLAKDRQATWTQQDLLRILRINVNLRGIRGEIDLTDQLHLLNIPLLLIHGAQDKIFPLSYFKAATRSLPDARTMVFEECGHMPQIEKAAEFNDSVIEFLKS